jgi:hypothetical protein
MQQFIHILVRKYCRITGCEIYVLLAPVLTHSGIYRFTFYKTLQYSISVYVCNGLRTSLFFLLCTEMEFTKVIVTKALGLWQLAIHSRGFFSDLIFPFWYQKSRLYISFPQLRGVGAGSSSPFYLGLY